MKAFASSLILALPFALIGSALAQHSTFTVNPGASKVNMTLKTNHDNVLGSFHIQSGAIQYDNSAHTMAGSVVVAAGSGDTGNQSRDKKMDKDILETQKYTTVTFAPRSYTGNIAPSGDSTIQVTGVITLLGNPHDITIPMQIHIDANNATAKASFPIPYVQWGLKDPSFFVLKAQKEVDIDLNLAGTIAH
ncbi:MAG: YceI family protein [Acidobacteria bacterium]|nr:YceI family protein [Acidobacteriota bacterium]